MIGISIAAHKFILPVSKKKDVKSTWVMYSYIIYVIINNDGEFQFYASWVSSCLRYQNTRRVFAKTQTSDSSLGIMPTGISLSKF